MLKETGQCVQTLEGRELNSNYLYWCVLHAVMQCRMQPVLSCSLARHVRRAGGVMTAGKLSPETLLTTTALTHAGILTFGIAKHLENTQKSF